MRAQVVTHVLRKSEQFQLAITQPWRCSWPIRWLHHNLCNFVVIFILIIIFAAILFRVYCIQKEQDKNKNLMKDSRILHKSPSTYNGGSRNLKKKCLVWGRHEKDLISVKIVISESNKGQLEMNHFEKLIFTPYGCTEEITADITSYFSKLDVHIKQTADLSQLLPLKSQLKDLISLIQSKAKDSTWEIFEDFSKDRLCRKVMTGFLHNMADSPGKEAFRSLISEIVFKLHLQDSLDVVHTGFRCHCTYLSTSVFIEREIESSSSPGTNDSIDSPEFECKPKNSLDSSKSKIIEPLKSSLKRKLCTSDVIVYSQRKLDKPIEAKLVISLKKGADTSYFDLIAELLSRLPYQSGHIFGLRINACEARMYSVKYDDCKDEVNIFTYQPFYTFKEHNQPFSLDSLFNLIIDIGKILHSTE